MSKRRRDPTFTTSEKEALLELVERHFLIIESKKTDAVSVKSKNEEWRKIATEFNAVSGIHPRDWTVLKNCWENLKKRAKQEQTLRNQHHLGTGGGPPKNTLEDPINNKVLELIEARVSGFVNCFDSDGTYVLASGANTHTLSSQETEPSLTQNAISESPTIVLRSEPIASTSTFDWSQYTPSMLREPKSSVLANSPDLSILKPISTQPKAPSTTPPRDNTDSIWTDYPASAGTNRRRPIYRRGTNGQSLNNERMKTLLKANANADEEHNLKMKILYLQEKKELELLKQEEIKTKQEEIKLKIFELQLKKLND